MFATYDVGDASNQPLPSMGHQSMQIGSFATRDKEPGMNEVLNGTVVFSVPYGRRCGLLRSSWTHWVWATQIHQHASHDCAGFAECDAPRSLYLQRSCAVLHCQSATFAFLPVLLASPCVLSRSSHRPKVRLFRWPQPSRRGFLSTLRSAVAFV